MAYPDTSSLTKDELNAPGGMSTQQGGYMSGYNPSLGGSNKDSGLQQTTTEQRGTTADRMQDFAKVTAEQQAQYDANEAQAQATRFGKTDNTYQAQLDAISAGAEQAQKLLSKQKAKEATGQTGEEATNQGSEWDRRAQEITDAANQQIADFEADMEEMQAKMDASYRALVNSTKKVYEDRVREMQKANQRLSQTKKTVGIRTGRERYTPVMQDGILQQEEIEGIQRVTKLNNELNMVLAQAADAKAANDLKAFNAAYDRKEAIMKEAQNTILKLYEQANKELELQQEAEKEARIAAKEQLDLEIKQADQVAPAVAARINELTTPEQQAEFINLIAENLGITPEYLYGSVIEAADEATKAALDNENTRSLIGSRADANARGWAAENRAQTKYDEETEEKEVKMDMRQDIIKGLQSGKLTVEQGRDMWGELFPIDEFDKEFASYINEI